jgi:hypothetical protein
MLVQSCTSLIWDLIWLVSLLDIKEVDPWLAPVSADCRIDLLLVVGAAGIWSASADTDASLIRTLACGDSLSPSFLVVALSSLFS